MHIIIKDLRHVSGKTSPHFWNAEQLRYQLTFSLFVHDYSTLETAQKQCPDDAVIVSELSRHSGAKRSIATYREQFPAATHLICLRRKNEWVVYGSHY